MFPMSYVVHSSPARVPLKNASYLGMLLNYYLLLQIKLPLRRNGVTFLTIACYMKKFISFLC